MRGTSWIKRMWYAWVSARPLLDFRGLGGMNGSIVNKGCLWLEYLGKDEGGLAVEEKRLIKKIRRKGLWKWDQIWEEEGNKIKEWGTLKREFNLSRRMRPLVEGRLERVRTNGVDRRGGDENWWRRVRWKDGTPILFPKTKFLYHGLVEGVKCQEKIERGWNFESSQLDWGAVIRKHWKSKLEAKIKLFFWKLIHKGLPVGGRVSHFVEDISCPRCGDRETIEHICWTGLCC